jgi:hypothetical protein
LHVVGLHGDEDKGVGLATVDFPTTLTTMREEGRAPSPAGSPGRGNGPPTAGPPPCISSVVGPYPFRGVRSA